MSPSRVPAILALLASVLALVFASYSTLDYAAHLDRHLHDVHCSFVPGAPPTNDAEPCRAAMYSPYSALLKEALWGGIPISLFALGAFAFMAGFAAYLAAAGRRAPRQAIGFFAAVSATPLLVSIVMFIISVTEVGSLCKTCVGIYVSSLLLAIAGLSGLGSLRGYDRPAVSFLYPVVWLSALGITTLLPAVVYASEAPDHSEYLTRCGSLKQATDEQGALLHVRGPQAAMSSTLFEDPMCPTCKAFHERLHNEGILSRLDAKLVMFPLDSECNWMLDRPLHPGACVLSKAVLCGKERANDVLLWAFDQQVYLTRAGKAGEAVLKEVIRRRWGDEMVRCMDSRETDVQLNNHLHYASNNSVPVSTPQFYLENRRVCDEDTDIGLRYALRRLAPQVLP